MLRIKLSKENGEKRERFASLPDSVKNHEHIHAAIANGVMAVWADSAAVREPAEMTVDVSSTPLAASAIVPKPAGEIVSRPGSAG